MDPSAIGLSAGPVYLPPGFDPSVHQPFDRNTGIAVLTRADELLADNEPEQALTLYSRVTGALDPDVQAAAWYGSGNVLYRLDREPEAMAAWQRAVALGETPVTYRTWRQIASTNVRDNDLNAALRAYRECASRAPREDRAEIASRLGWLSKETGHTGAAGNYFARSRETATAPYMTYGIMALTVIVSLAAMANQSRLIDGTTYWPLIDRFELNSVLVAHGQYYRLFSVMLVHDPTSILHLFFNMYALYYGGLLAERLFGPLLTLGFYIVCGLAASTLSYAMGSGVPAVGASGAIFGLFGIVLIATRVHKTMLDRQWNAIATQIGFLIVLNLFIGFSGAFNIDNYAHIGGLLAGMWLGLVFPPTLAPTLGSMWQQRREPARPRNQTIALKVAGVVLLLGVIGLGILDGTSTWSQIPVRGQPGANLVVPREAQLVVRTQFLAPAEVLLGRQLFAGTEVLAPAESIQDPIHLPSIQA